MIKLIQEEAVTLGASPALVELINKHSEKAMLAWFVKRTYGGEDVTIYDHITAIAQMVELPRTQVAYAYYLISERSLATLELDSDYVYVRAVIEDKYPVPLFWDSVMPFIYKTAKRFAIGLMASDGADVTDIIKELKISRSMAYKLRKEYLDNNPKKDTQCQ